MTDDVPVQLVLHPPSGDVETSDWGMFAFTLFAAGLIWGDFEQAVFENNGFELRIWCTFTDRMAFQTWRSHPLVVARCGNLLSTPIELIEIATPWAAHERLCSCTEITEYVLRGHRVGNDKAILYCGVCSGYLPAYRAKQLMGESSGAVESWSQLSGHVYHIWLETAELEDWAMKELSDPVSNLNTAGRSYASALSQSLGNPVWYDLFIESDAVSRRCPDCGSQCEDSIWMGATYRCVGCRIVY